MTNVVLIFKHNIYILACKIPPKGKEKKKIYLTQLLHKNKGREGLTVHSCTATQQLNTFLAVPLVNVPRTRQPDELQPNKSDE